MYLKLCFLILFYMSFSFPSFSQQFIEDYENKIDSIFVKLRNAENDSLKMKLCYDIEAYMQKALLLTNSMDYPFKKLNNMGKILSPDKKIKILNWNCTLAKGDYRYFCIIQHSLLGKNTIVSLKQNLKLKSSIQKQLSPQNWLGALYYKIIPFKTKKQTAYALLAWDGNNIRTNKKLIEILSINKTGNIVFGLPVIHWRGNIFNRVIFEYAQQARMSLSYNESKKRIIFDHLSPSESRYTGQKEYYGPDFSYDALEYKKNRWTLYENIDVRNAKK